VAGKSTTNGNPVNELDSRREWVLTALEQFEGRLVRYATRLIGDEHAARDAVQHTFLRLCRESPDEIGQRLAAWLFTVCRNRVLDWLRLAGRESSLDVAKAEEDSSSSLAPSTWNDDPAAIVEREEVHARIRGAIDELPPSQREAVLLYAEGFRYREIAAITARTEGAVRVVVHRAIAGLRLHPRLQCLFEAEETTH
jgi:RNA polymerase sigma-70 factor (ECF subfamily)